MDQATGGVPAKECALRSLQDFHPIDIKDRKGLRLRYRDITLIQIYRIGCFDDVVKVILGDAADGELGVLPGEVPRDVYARCKTSDVEALAHPQRIHLCPGEGGDGNWHVLKVLLALLCDNNDFLEYALGLRSSTEKGGSDGCGNGG